MLGRIILKAQKWRINGPFERVTFIDPYPDKILKYPTFPATNLLIALGLLSFPIAFVIGYCGANPEIERSLRNEITEEIGRIIYLQIGNIAEYFQTDRIDVLGYLIPALLILGISLFITSNWLSRRLVAQAWQKKCKTAPAKILDTEIQKYLISQDHDKKPESGYVLRIKVKFTYRGQVYEATPSVVNRISPGSIGLHFKTKDACENLLATYQQSLEVEFDPQNPLDCEIKGNLDALLNTGNRPWLFIGIFIGALIFFSQLFVYIIKNQPS